MTHPIPAIALQQHIAILAKTGAGKTTAAKGIVEHVASIDPGRQITYVDTVLTGSYQKNDLRKTLFFRAATQGRLQHVGRYTGNARMFCGIASNELMLISAECHARTGNPAAAITLLNELLKKRFKEGTFADLDAQDADSTLNLVLFERRKELVFSGQTRWEDLRRLSKEKPVKLSRHVNGQNYELLPGDKRYVLPFPDLEIQLSGIAQNQR